MPGFDHDPLADVEAIRQLLEGYKTGYPFLKEALQNAQDARATKVWFQWHRGLGSQTEHPLLRGPALIVVNDGPFDEESQRGIRLIGLSNRAADTERIGRFGLGIKSLFHVCEGFFYMESSLTEGLRGFLTPWHASEEAATKYHRGWWSVGDGDWQQMADEIGQALPKTFGPWFALWIPLRTAPRLDGVEAIRADCPGASRDHCDFSLISAFEARSPSLAESMIFLDRLKSVEFHDGQSMRLRLRNEPETDTSCNTIGDIKFWTDCFNVPNHPKVEEIRSNERWPKVSDRRTGGQAKDKASWQGGVAVSYSPTCESQPALRVFWSVFLPVGNKPVVDIPLRNLNAGLHIFLHGYFFPNRDRTLVFGADENFGQSSLDSEDGLKQEWNGLLSNSPDGVLTRIIPTLEEYFKVENVDSSTITEIVGGLSGSEFFNTYRRAICQKLSYVRALTMEGWSWRTLDSETKLVVVPLLDCTLANLERILLSVIAPARRDQVVVVSGQSYLSRKELLVDWNGDDLRWFCESLDIAMLEHTEEGRDFIRSLLVHFHFAAESCKEAWVRLPLYRAIPIRGPHQLASTVQILEWHQRSSLFCRDESRWSHWLRDACPNLKIWFIQGVPPPGLNPPLLEYQATAQVVLNHAGLAAHGNRLNLLQGLLNFISESDVSLAVRYLAHGSFDHRRDSELLYFCSTDQDPDNWGQVIRIILSHRGESWRAVPADFADHLSPDQASSLRIAKTDAAAFRHLCSSPDLDLSSLPLAPFRKFLMLHLEGGTHFDPDADNKLLRRLRIHDCGRNQFTVIDEHSWLAPDAGLLPPQSLLPLWSNLCQKARIVQRAEDRHVVFRQEQVFGQKILDRNGIISLACSQFNPELFAPLILFCLGHGNPNAEARKSLLETAWLPVSGGVPAKIEQLLWLENVEDELDALVRTSEAKGFVVTRRMVSLGLHERESKGAWNTLSTQLIPKGDEALALLELAFESCTRLHLGITVRGCDELAEWLRATEGIEQDFSAASSLIRKLWSQGESQPIHDARALAEKVASVFARPWQGDDALLYDNALEALRQRHQEADASLRVVVVAIFCRYLEQAFKAGNWTRYRRDFELLNQRGEWKPLGRLVRPCAGLDAAFLVDEAQSYVLDLQKDPLGDLDQATETDIADSAEATAEMLKSYGRALPNLHHRHWGAFVALFGNDAPVRFLAENLTEDLSGFRVRLIPNSDARDKLSHLHFRCTLLDGSSVEMHALNGDLINVPVSSVEGSFLVPDKHGRLVGWEIRGDQHVHRIRLLSPQRFRELSSADLLDKLELTIRQLLDSALNTSPSDLASFFNQIVGLQEQSLGVAQQSILLGAEMHLQQLSWRKLGHAGLVQAFKLLEESKELEARARQQEHAGYAGDEEPLRNHRESAKKRENALAILEPLLREDDGLNKLLALAMRRKIGESGYVAESIPFEIFQNADDAVGELLADKDVPPVFVVEICSNCVRFAHWGRVINSTTKSDEPWMRQDLVKMIQLSGSDKEPGNSETRPTGKFGLGFKSVYLICDQPRAISGSLEFEVRGATYPALLPPDDAAPLRKWLSERMPLRKEGTAFELPLRTPGQHDWLMNFRALAGYLPLFARHLQEIRIIGHEPATQRWSGGARIETDQCIIETGSGGDTGRLLTLSSARRGLCWVFGWSGSGFRKLPASVPSLWITAPTRTRELGIILNGPFEPDPGRGGLGAGVDAAQINVGLFADAATLLAEGIKVLNQADGPARLGIEDHEIPGVWQTAWDLFALLPAADRENPAAHDNILSAIWPPDCNGGYANIVANHRVVPNGMPGAFASLTSIALISYRTTGYLEHAEGKALLDSMGTWPEWMEAGPEKFIEPSRIATTSIINTLQRHLGSGALQVDDISLRFMLHRILADSHVSERMAGLLGVHLSEDTFSHSHGDKWLFEEEEIRGFLETLQFQNASGDWVASQELLSEEQPDYEPLRAAFAPASRILSTGYSSLQAQCFFRLCRGDMRVTAEDMAGWIGRALDHGDSARLSAAFMFLASSDDVAASCAGQLSRVDKSRLLSCDEFGELEIEDRIRVQATFSEADAKEAKRLGVSLAPDFYQGGLDEGLAEVKSISIDALIAVWEGNEAEAIERFTLSGQLRPLVFPDIAGDANLSARLRDTDSLKGKAAWYRLLCLGCALSLPLGRTPYDRIMKFWDKRLGDDFWSATIPETLAEGTSPKFEQRLDRFFEEVIHRTFRDENASGEEADFWRRVFYDFRKMHFFVFGESNLPGLVLQIAHSDGVGGGQLVQFLRSGHVPLPLQTPGNERWSGVVGQSMSGPLLFVMRELRRLGLLPDGFDSACYYMNSPARKVASQLGWLEISQQRHASFADLLALSASVSRSMQEEAPQLIQHFDLPLQWFAHQHL